MAEIRVEPRRSSVGWVWVVVGLVLVAAVVWYLTTHRTRRDAVPAEAPAAPTKLHRPSSGALTMQRWT